MEEKLLGQFKTGVIWGKLLVYRDRIEIRGLVNNKTIPVSKIADVSYNKLLSQLIIETSGGQKTTAVIFRREVEKAANLITSLIGK